MNSTQSFITGVFSLAVALGLWLIVSSHKATQNVQQEIDAIHMNHVNTVINNASAEWEINHRN